MKVTFTKLKIEFDEILIQKSTLPELRHYLNKIVDSLYENRENSLYIRDGNGDIIGAWRSEDLG